MTSMFDPTTWLTLQTVGLVGLAVAGSALALWLLPWTDREISDVDAAARDLVLPGPRFQPAEG